MQPSYYAPWSLSLGCYGDAEAGAGRVFGDNEAGRRPEILARAVAPAIAWDNKLVSRVRELEQRLERTEQQLRLLQKISRYLVRQTKLQDALDGVVVAGGGVHGLRLLPAVPAR